MGGLVNPRGTSFSPPVPITFNRREVRRWLRDQKRRTPLRMIRILRMIEERVANFNFYMHTRNREIFFLVGTHRDHQGHKLPNLHLTVVVGIQGDRPRVDVGIFSKSDELDAVLVWDDHPDGAWSCEVPKHRRANYKNRAFRALTEQMAEKRPHFSRGAQGIIKEILRAVTPSRRHS